MNTKVIFYGNCQLGELSIRMHYELGFRDSFRVILPGDYGVDLSGEEGYSFARYLFFTSKKNPICPRALNSAFSDADVAFLHNVSAETFGEESSSKAICSKYASCKKIFVTNFWFDPYCQVDEIITKLFFSGIREPQEVLDFMLHEYDPFIEKSVFEKYKNQVEKLEVKEKACLKISDIHISLLDFVKKRWLEESLCGDNAPHPTSSVFCFLQEAAFKILGIPVSVKTFDKISSVREGGVQNQVVRKRHPFILTKLKYFGIIFPKVFASTVLNEGVLELESNEYQQVKYIKDKILELESSL